MVDKHIIIDITGDQFSGKSTFLNYDQSSSGNVRCAGGNT